MDSSFRSRDSRILVIDPSGVIRPVVSDVLRHLGFRNFRGCSAIKDAVHSIGLEPADWVIAPLLAQQEENSLQLLHFLAMTEGLHGVRVSLLVEQTEEFCLGKAYELGLLSWHKVPFTKTTLTDTFGELLRRYEANGWDGCLTAADYLREWLQGRDRKSSWLELEKNLVDLYANRPQQLLYLAKARIASGEYDLASKEIRQVAAADPELASEAEALLATLPKDESTEQASEALRFGKCIVVDPDESSRATIRQHLTQLGEAEVLEFNDGESAWSWIEENPKPALLIHEWRLPKLSGALLLQRIRSRGYAKIVCIAVSSLIKPRDLPVLNEMGVAAVVAKPLIAAEFRGTLLSVLTQHNNPTEARSLERKIRAHILEGDLHSGEQYLSRYVSDARFPRSVKSILAGEIAYAKGAFGPAKEAAVTGIRLGERSVFSFNLLGRALMKLGDHRGALSCFQKAEELSPNNIERLCAIAEAQTELGDTQAADATLSEIDSLDPDNPLVADLAARCALKTGQTERLHAILAAMDSVNQFVAYMNNQAVALARASRFDESIGLYQTALDAVPDSHAHVRPVIRYNMSLALVRQGELEKAAELLREQRESDSPTGRKSASLLKRLNAALATGTPLQLRSLAEDPRTDQAADPASVLAVEEDLQSGRGDRCCYLVHFDDDSDDEKTEAIAWEVDVAAMQKIYRRALGLGSGDKSQPSRR